MEDSNVKLISMNEHVNQKINSYLGLNINFQVNSHLVCISYVFCLGEKNDRITMAHL